MRSKVKDYDQKLIFRLGMLFKFLSGSRKVIMIPRSEREKQIIRRWIIGGVIIFGVIFIIVLIVSYFNSYDLILDGSAITQKNNISASLFGTIIGSILSGVFIILTTYFIVHQSSRADYHKERLDNLPVLEVIADKSKSKTKKEEGQIIKMGYDSNYIFIEIINIGKGIAFNVFTDFPDIEEYEQRHLGIIKVNGNRWILLGHEENDIIHRLRFTFSDIFENKYSQTFLLHYKIDKDIDYVESAIPQLIQRTRRLRYIQ